MKKLFTHPLFLCGLLLKVGLFLAVAPTPILEWYAPFLNDTAAAFTLDPWGYWLDHGGAAEAFPYGYVMWLLFLPGTWFSMLLGLPALYGYGATLLAADTALLYTLRQITGSSERTILLTYWLSPIVLAAIYLWGFNDIVPVLLMVLSLASARQQHWRRAGLLLAAAVSAKLSMVIAIPFFLIYLINNRAIRQFLPQFIGGGALGATLFLLPFLYSAAGLSMLLTNPEMEKIYALAIPLGALHVYLVPLCYLLMLYAIWRVKRPNFELFHAMLGLSFLLVVLLTPSAPGWFIWTIPLLVTYQLAGNRIAMATVAAFSLLYLLSYGLQLQSLPLPANAKILSLLHTALIATGIILAMRILRTTISRNDYFRLSRKPFVLGIAGDSGSGKDTFASSLAGLFGAHSVATLSGDDYHLWDRKKPMWQVMTHLNPMANDLEKFAQDLVALTDGKTIKSSHYDHDTGKKSRACAVRSNDFIIASGLHALYLPLLRQCFNVSIYLDIDENLRRHFKLTRDTVVRGHSAEKVLASLEQRAPDAARFIHPQAAHADIVFALQPVNPERMEPLKLVVRLRDSLNELSLTRVLVGICGLHVERTVHQDGAEVELTLEGEISAQDIALAATLVCPRVLEFLDISPEWQDGMSGLMQLITLSQINQALTERFV